MSKTSDHKRKDAPGGTRIEKGSKRTKTEVEKPRKPNSPDEVDGNGAGPKDNTVSKLYEGVKSSRDAHVKQRALVKERKASKPNADSIGRAKKIWERLRLKSHVPKDERDVLVAELFTIISGRVHEFVFKHDSVRTIQCALKYARPDQRKEIARELIGHYKALAESRYAKFLIAKLLVQGDNEVKDWIISEFCGSVKRLINHPEASWILDDTYRQVANKAQKATMLREWYGPEYSVLKSSSDDKIVSGDVLEILEQYPEKRKPIMEHLSGMINQLVQKKMTGFTMLHDAMLQYSLAIYGEQVSESTESTAATEFMDLLKDAEDQSFLPNLAFTASGSRVVRRALAFSNAKDRKLLLRPYKDHIETLAGDPNGVTVLIAALEVVDDTVMTSKLVFPPLLGSKYPDREAKYTSILEAGVHPNAKLPLLLPMTEEQQTPKWLVKPDSTIDSALKECYKLRTGTSKKDPQKRRVELRTQLLTLEDHALVDTVQVKAGNFMATSFGCQFITEALLGASRCPSLRETQKFEAKRLEAMEAVAKLAGGDPAKLEHPAQIPHVGRALKTLVAGAGFNDVSLQNPGSNQSDASRSREQVGFAAILYPHIKDYVTQWATGSSSFVVANLVDPPGFQFQTDCVRALKGEKNEGLAALEKMASIGNKGSKIILESLA